MVDLSPPKHTVRQEAHSSGSCSVHTGQLFPLQRQRSQMISQILTASIRARLTEVTTLGEHKEQAFLKLAQNHTLDIYSLFKNTSAGCMQEEHWQNSTLMFHLHTTKTIGDVNQCLEERQQLNYTPSCMA